jgi:hypothetical protein
MEELIKKHIGALSQQSMLSSVEYFVQTGKVSGSFFMALKAMMQEYHEQQVKNLNIQDVIKCTTCAFDKIRLLNKNCIGCGDDFCNYMSKRFCITKL